MFNESCNRVVTHAHRVASEEIFGPVLSVMTFRTPEEAFERANNILSSPESQRSKGII